MKSSAMLDTGGESLVWCGTAVGSQASQSLYIRNVSQTEETLLLSIRHGQYFKFDAYPKPSTCLEVTMPACGERHVTVLFCPSHPLVYRDTALIQPASKHHNEPHRRNITSVCLSGYAGSSDVQIHVNARDSSGRPCLNVTSAPSDVNSCNYSRVANFTIANMGVRSAYIKLLIFSDSSCLESMTSSSSVDRANDSGDQLVRPSQFILASGASRQVRVSLPPTPSGPGPADGVSGELWAATLLVLSGDESLRRLYKQSPLSGVLSSSVPDNLADVDFMCLYECEISSVEDDISDAVPLSKVDDLFFVNMKQTRLPLKCLQRQSISVKSRSPAFTSVHDSSTMFNISTNSTASSTPLSCSSSPSFSSLPSTPGSVPLSGQRSLQRQPSITDSPLELCTRRCPQSTVASSAPTLHTAATLTTIDVQGRVDSGWWPCAPGRERVHAEPGRPHFRLSSDHVLFERTPIGVPRQRSLLLANRGHQSLRYNLFGYSMPYLITEPGQMVKCGYDVFKVRPQEGEAKPGEEMTLTVTFSPPYPGQLTQLFQLLCKPAVEAPGAPMVVCTMAVQLSGRGSVLDDGESIDDVLATPLHVSSTALHFQHWSVCHQLEIANKLNQDLPVEYRVTGPFRAVAGPVKRTASELTAGCLSAPSQRYLNMAVYFCPPRVGSYSGQLLFRLPAYNWQHMVALTGSCDDVDPAANTFQL